MAARPRMPHNYPDIGKHVSSLIADTEACPSPEEDGHNTVWSDSVPSAGSSASRDHQPDQWHSTQ